MSDYNLGVVPFGGIYNQYGYDNLDLDMNYGSYPMFGAGSIFGAGFATPPMMGGGYYGFNYDEFYNNMRRQQQFQTEYNVDQQQLNRNADLRINAPLEAIKGSATALKDKIVNNEQDQIQEAYERYVNAVAAAYGDTSDKKIIRARANSLYASMNNGVSLVQDLRQYGHGSATQGFIQSLTFGLYNRHSAEDNVAYITGSPVGSGEKTKHNLGRVAGAVTVGGIAGGLAKACAKGSSKLAKACSGKAKIIGLAAGGLAAALSFLTGKVTT